MESELITELYLLWHCDKCNVVLENTKHWIESEWLDLCDDCYHKEYAFCDGCQEDFKHEDITVINDEEQYCNDCLKDMENE